MARYRRAKGIGRHHHRRKFGMRLQVGPQKPRTTDAQDRLQSVVARDQLVLGVQPLDRNFALVRLQHRAGAKAGQYGCRTQHVGPVIL